MSLKQSNPTPEERIAWNTIRSEMANGDFDHLVPPPQKLSEVPSNTRMGYINKASGVIGETGGSHLRLAASKFMNDLCVSRGREAQADPLKKLFESMNPAGLGTPISLETVVAKALVEITILAQNDCDPEVLNSKINQHIQECSLRYKKVSSLADALTVKTPID